MSQDICLKKFINKTYFINIITLKQRYYLFYCQYSLNKNLCGIFLTSFFLVCCSILLKIK